MNGIYTDPKCTDCTKIYRCEAAHTNPQLGENYGCFKEKEEITQILGYCPSPDTIVVQLHPEDEGREKAARLAEELAKERRAERIMAEADWEAWDRLQEARQEEDHHEKRYQEKQGGN